MFNVSFNVSQQNDKESGLHLAKMLIREPECAKKMLKYSNSILVEPFWKVELFYLHVSVQPSVLHQVRWFFNILKLSLGVPIEIAQKHIELITKTGLRP